MSYVVAGFGSSCSCEGAVMAGLSLSSVRDAEAAIGAAWAAAGWRGRRVRSGVGHGSGEQGGAPGISAHLSTSPHRPRDAHAPTARHRHQRCRPRAPQTSLQPPLRIALIR